MSFSLTTVGEYATIQGGYAYKSQDFQLNGQWPVLKIKNIRKGYISYDDTSFVSNEIASATKNWMTNEGDILISMTGSGPNAPESLVGRVARVWEDERPALINQRVGRLVLRGNKKIDPDFLFYVLSSKECQSYLVSNSTGSANQVNISSKTIESIECLCIDFETSKAIAEILKTLDKRIRLLIHTNKTLELIAQALFKSWFVDFDPVHAKAMRYKSDGIDAETAMLFPDSFEESILGLIPKEWNVRRIGEVVQIQGGGTPSTKEPAFWQPEKYHWVTPKDLSHISAPVLLNTDRKISVQGLAKVSSGLLPINTLLMSSRAPIGYLAIAKIPTAINQGFIAILPHSELSPVFLFLWCMQNMESIKQKANGSTFMEISKSAFRTIPMIYPSSNVLNAFTEITSPLFERITENERQAQTLATLRDILLPRLISGRLRLSEIKVSIEDAAS